MTFEELKAEADKQGYKLVVYKKIEPFLPCTCGCNRRTHWYSYKNGENNIRLCCNRCGKSASGKTEAEARRNWNALIREELNADK